VDGAIPSVSPRHGCDCPRRQCEGCLKIGGGRGPDRRRTMGSPPMTRSVRSTTKAANFRLNDMVPPIHLSQHRPQLRRDKKICCDPYDIHTPRDCKKSTPNTRSASLSRRSVTPISGSRMTSAPIANCEKRWTRPSSCSAAAPSTVIAGSRANTGSVMARAAAALFEMTLNCAPVSMNATMLRPSSCTGKHKWSPSDRPARSLNTSRSRPVQHPRRSASDKARGGGRPGRYRYQSCSACRRRAPRRAAPSRRSPHKAARREPVATASPLRPL